MLRIKEFARRCGCSVYTLRYYDEIGVLNPKIIHDKSGYRYYSEEQIQEYERIKEFQDIGFTIQEIINIQTMDHNQIINEIYKKIDILETNIKKAIILIEKYR